MNIRKWLRFKHSVYAGGVHPNLLSGLAEAARVWRDVAGKPCTVTSLVDGRHRSDSFHYCGMAADLRTKDLEPHVIDDVLEALQAALGNGWDVVLEYPGEVNEHIHMEWDRGRQRRQAFLDALQDTLYDRIEGNHRG